MAGPSKSQCGILQNCWDALQDEIIEQIYFAFVLQDSSTPSWIEKNPCGNIFCVKAALSFETLWNCV